MTKMITPINRLNKFNININNNITKIDINTDNLKVSVDIYNDKLKKKVLGGIFNEESNKSNIPSIKECGHISLEYKQQNPTKRLSNKNSRNR